MCLPRFQDIPVGNCVQTANNHGKKGVLNLYTNFHVVVQRVGYSMYLTTWTEWDVKVLLHERQSLTRNNSGWVHLTKLDAVVELTMRNFSRTHLRQGSPTFVKMRVTPWVPINAKGYQFDTHLWNKQHSFNLPLIMLLLMTFIYVMSEDTDHATF